MEEHIVKQILGLLDTIQEACGELFQYAQEKQTVPFQLAAADMEQGLTCILRCIQKPMEDKEDGCVKLYPMCQSVLHSLQRICVFYREDHSRCCAKIEYELLPLIQEAKLNFYFFAYAVKQENGKQDYYRDAMMPLSANSYIDEAMKTGHYRYEVSFIVLAYNKLEYTKRCVESLLKNIPKGLNYELIFVNHGSTDGTQEYFESCHPDKQLDIFINGGGVGACYRIVEGEFSVLVSNDVLVLPNALENLLACIRSDPKIAWAVPTTPNVSNLQSIPAHYSSEEEMIKFAENNNHLDPFRWEQRVRLCNPIDIQRNSVLYSSQGLSINGYFHSMDYMSFSDDRTSTLLRRNGYKMMLVKDAYCHHFGSVTLKDEVKKQSNNEEALFYLKGRQIFQQVFDVDPWGIGFCYDPVFLQRVVDEVSGSIEILGINCGLGGNSLKIKEQVREYGKNTDVTLTNITDRPVYFKDLSGVSDQACIIQNKADFFEFMKTKQYHYIVWEDSFLDSRYNKTVYEQCWEHLVPGGILFIKRNSNDRLLSKKLQPLGNGWHQEQTEDKNTPNIIREDLKAITASDLPWEKFHNSSVLVTGAAGMIPSYVVLALAYYRETHPDCEMKIVALVRNMQKAERCFSQYKNCHWFRIFQKDVSDASVEELGNFDYIIHGASPADPRQFGENPVATFLPNVLGTYRLLELAKKSQTKGFLFLSSGEVYGAFPTDVETITEMTFGALDPIELRSCYGEGKRAGETLCALYSYQYQIPVTAARICHTFGPSMDIKKDSRVFSEFVNCVIHNENLVMKSDGSAVRPFCYLSDTVEAIFRILLCGQTGQAYQIAGDEYFSILELANLLCEIYPERELHVVKKQRSFTDPYLQSPYQQKRIFDTSKLKELGWKVKVSVKDGFARTISALEGGRKDEDTE